MSKWLLILSTLAILGSAAVTFIEKLDDRFSRLESAGEKEPRYATRLTKQLARLREELTSSRSKLNSYTAEQRRQAALRTQVVALEKQLSQTLAILESQSEQIAGVDERQDVLLRETLGKRLKHLNQDLEARWDDVSRTLEATARIAENNRHTFDDFVRDLPHGQPKTRDVVSMWADLMGPTVQIADESTVGSGVLLVSEEAAPGKWRTHVLTAWHVVRDILDDSNQLEQLIPVHLYGTDGERGQRFATLVEHDARIDIALLVIRSNNSIDYGALMPSRERLTERRVFDSIYAVGCPLGNDPIPTYGEIADTNHKVEGDSYWMISAPTYIGNSGGGIFDAETHELLGIFSKIYTHGNLRPTVIPHMGLVTPLGTIYDWLEEAGQGHLVPE